MACIRPLADPLQAVVGRKPFREAYTLVIFGPAAVSCDPGPFKHTGVQLPERADFENPWPDGLAGSD